MPDVAYATIFLHAATTGLATYVVFASPGVFDQSDFLFFNVRLALLSPLEVAINSVISQVNGSMMLGRVGPRCGVGGCFGCGGVRHSFLTVFGEQPQSLAVARKVPTRS